MQTIIFQGDVLKEQRIVSGIIQKENMKELNK